MDRRIPVNIKKIQLQKWNFAHFFGFCAKQAVKRDIFCLFWYEVKYGKFQQAFLGQLASKWHMTGIATKLSRFLCICYAG